MDYTKKYLKYKSKYLELKELIAGAKPSEAERKAERARREAEVQKAKLAKNRIAEIIDQTQTALANWEILAKEYGVSADNIRLIGKRINRA